MEMINTASTSPAPRSRQRYPMDGKWILVLSSILLTAAYFIPWVNWDKTPVSGSGLASGEFFRISESQFQVANPFPQFSFSMAAFWLLPLMAVVSLVLALLNKRVAVPAIVAGAMGLCLVSIYVLFSNTLRDLGVDHHYQLGIFLATAASAMLILSAPIKWFAKIAWLVLPPLITFSGFYLASKHIEGQVYDDADTKAAYTLTADQLISEFRQNDSLANSKYSEQIVTVNGKISAIDIPNDSTANVKFADSTGSYVIFPFHAEDVPQIRRMKEGQEVSLKGSCSGGRYSEILETESITFKRSVINK